MECDRCGAPRPPRGPCPECGAPPPGPGGSHSSMRGWRDTARTGQGPAAGRGSGANWGPGASGSRQRGSGADWRANGGWDEGGGYGYEDDPAPAPSARSSNRNRRRPQPDYEEVDLERALVPTRGDMMPMDPAAMGAGVPAPPGLPGTDEEERALGIRRPVYIPATGEKRKRKLGTWRVTSGVLSVMLVCIASCGLAGIVGHDRIASLLAGPKGALFTPVVYNTANVPATPVATPGPASKYVKNVVTATSVDGSFFAIGPTSHFTAGNNNVYVVASVRNAPSGQHTVSIRWFLQGVALDHLPGSQSQSINKDSQVYFALSFPSPGVGMAKLYWDMPADDPGTDPNDPALAATIYFFVQPSNVTPSASGTPGTVTPTNAPKPTNTPKK